MHRILLLCLPFLVAADWPQHLGTNRDGHSSETGLLRSWPKDGPPLLWKRDAGTGWAGPAIAGDRLILFHRVDDKEVLECLHPATGKAIWKSSYATRYRDDFNFDDGPRSVPLIAGKQAFTLGADGDLRAWNLETGAAIWDRHVNKEYGVEKGFFGTATSPILAGGKLLINVGAKGAGIVAFDPATGKELWKASDDGVSYSSPVVGKLGDEELAIFFTRAGLLAVSPEKGEVKHRFPWRPRINASVNAATPIVSGGRVFIPTSYSTGAVVLEVKGGKLEEVWSGDKSISSQYSTPVLIKDHLFGIDGRADQGQAVLRCVEWASGKVKWTEKAFGCAGLIAANGLLIACAENGDVVLIDPSTESYKELARARMLDLPVRALPALSGGKLFVRDGKKLVALGVGKQ